MLSTWPGVLFLVWFSHFELLLELQALLKHSNALMVLVMYRRVVLLDNTEVPDSLYVKTKMSRCWIDQRCGQLCVYQVLEGPKNLSALRNSRTSAFLELLCIAVNGSYLSKMLLCPMCTQRLRDSSDWIPLYLQAYKYKQVLGRLLRWTVMLHACTLHLFEVSWYQQ